MSADNIILFVEVENGIEIYDVSFSCISGRDFWFGRENYSVALLHEKVRSDYQRSYEKTVPNKFRALRWYKNYCKNWVCEYGYTEINMEKTTAAEANNA